MNFVIITLNHSQLFGTSNYGNNRPLPIGKNKKAFGLFKGEFRGQIMKEFAGPIKKTYAYLMDSDTEHKKAKETKNCKLKRELTFKIYKDCLFNDKIILKSQQGFKSEYHNVYNEQINEIVLSSNYGKRLQTLGKTTTSPNGRNTFEVYESEMSSKIYMINFDDYANENNII